MCSRQLLNCTREKSKQTEHEIVISVPQSKASIQVWDIHIYKAIHSRWAVMNHHHTLAHQMLSLIRKCIDLGRGLSMDNFFLHNFMKRRADQISQKTYTTVLKISNKVYGKYATYRTHISRMTCRLALAKLNCSLVKYVFWNRIGHEVDDLSCILAFECNHLIY